ncbi:MAG: type B 50S ribosomal protein L31 [Verrucomicrobiota bacterium]
MKKGIHPELNPTVFVDLATNREFATRSTIKTEETRVIEGVEHFVVKCGVTSDSHPAYTGQTRLVDTAGRVDKFQKRFGESILANRKKKKKAGK